MGWILQLLREDDSEKSQALREVVGKDYTVEYTQFDWEFNGVDPEEEGRSP